ENALFTGGDINKDTGLAFEIKDAKDIMGIYHPGGDSMYGNDDEPDSTISLVDSSWDTMLSYAFPYNGLYEYEYISYYAISIDRKWISLYYSNSGKKVANPLVLYNADTQKMGDKNYRDFIRVDSDTFFGRCLEDGHIYSIDIFDNSGTIKATIESV